MFSRQVCNNHRTLLSLKNLDTPRLCWAGLLLVLVLHLVVNALWINQDETFRSWDMGAYLFAAVHLFDVVQAEPFEAVFRILRSKEGAIWPGGVFLPWVALSQVFGHSVAAFRSYNIFYMAVLLLAMFLLGRRLHSPRAGLLAAALASLYPAIYGECRQFGADFPGTAMTALGMVTLLYTERFSRPGRSALFGLAVGAAVLVRAQAAFFLLAPSVLLLTAALVRPTTSRSRVVISAALCLLSAAAATAVWWFGALTALMDSMIFHARATEDIRPGMEPSALFYLKVLPAMVTPFLLLVLAAAVMALLQSRRRVFGWAWLYDPRLAPIWAWLAGGFLYVSLNRVRYMRYMLPLIPALALLTAVGLLSIGHRTARRVTIFLALGVASFTWLADSFFVPATELWGYKDDPSSATRRYIVTSGPPAATPLFAASEKIGVFLRGRHQSGRDLLVELRYPPTSQCRHCFRFCIGTRPNIAARLPGPFFRCNPEAPRPFPEPGEDLFMIQIGMAQVPALPARFRHRYVISFDEGPGPLPDPPLPARRVYRDRFADLLSKTGQTRVTIWYEPMGR